MDEILGLFSLLIIITIFYIIKRFLNRLFTNKRCTWCKSPSLKFISGEIGNLEVNYWSNGIFFKEYSCVWSAYFTGISTL